MISEIRRRLDELSHLPPKERKRRLVVEEARGVLAEVRAHPFPTNAKPYIEAMTERLSGRSSFEWTPEIRSSCNSYSAWLSLVGVQVRRLMMLYRDVHKMAGPGEYELLGKLMARMERLLADYRAMEIPWLPKQWKSAAALEHPEAPPDLDVLEHLSQWMTRAA